MAFNIAYRIWSAFRNGMNHSHFEHQKDDHVETASDHSFPASDPPSWTKSVSKNPDV